MNVSRASRRTRPSSIVIACVTAITCSPASPTQPASLTADGASNGAVVSSVAVLLAAPSIRPGDTTIATAQVSVAGRIAGRKKITWRSTNASVVTVHWSRGVVVGVAPGVANIVGTLDGVSGQAPITVSSAGTPAAVASVAVALGESELAVGAQTTATAKVRDLAGHVLDDRVVAWRSENPSAAIVTASGTVTAVGGGTAAIVATAEGVSGQSTLTVRMPVASVSVALASRSLVAGQATTASAVLRDANNNVLTGRTVSWTSSNSSVATVNASSGQATAVAPGKAAIVASAEGESGADTLSVTAPPPAGDATVVFQDGFESGNFSRTENGVAWVSAPWVDVSPAIAHSGTRAARFRQGESGTWSELRFGGLPNLTEAFIQFYIYYPNGTENPSVGTRVVTTGPANDKFFRLWGNVNATYFAVPGSKVGASMWGDGTGTNAQLGIEYQYSPASPPQWSIGEGYPSRPRIPFLNDANRGRWLRIRIHTKVATAANNDGVIQIWVDDALVLDHRDLHNYPYGIGPNTYTHGYLLGYANNGFRPGQYTYIDDVVISTGGFASP